ncbi:gas vesicle protein [Zooshikella marina]|uniref:gas vesicle protein n=1 Tax=Zooshikella ganghwensis TaxID=202772 RepID=UPI001BAFA0E5|nr:gas vesicle protein [Zooshikella ganghwensis]MBU2704747.1 gas vesicle protein [Zooshikella ganghwensis]
MSGQQTLTHATDSTTVADLLERVLDKGLVISGDIRIKLVDVELLTIEIRLLICSVDKAVEMGLDWWRGNPAFAPGTLENKDSSPLEKRLEKLEQQLANQSSS